MTSVNMTGLTDPGRVRLENEDSIATRPDLGLAVLADGMGGHQAGEVASRLAIDVITRHFVEASSGAQERAGASGGLSPEAHIVDRAIQLANDAIFATARERPECAGMGSTIVVAYFHGGRVIVGHVGDSRLYRLRHGRLAQLTQDHSVVQELVNRGLFTAEEARQSIGKNLVTRALGVEPTVASDLSEQAVEPGDTYLLCSDGLNDMVSDAEIERLLSERGDDLEAAARGLVAHANERGGPDNISVIVVRLPNAGAAAKVADGEGRQDGAADEFRVTRHDIFLPDD